MTSDQKKILGEERRNLILQELKDSPHPITGSELAARTNVSRQVIVGDITLLKAKNEPIIATSQGYMYLKPSSDTRMYERNIACCHAPSDTEKELHILVDHGVTIKDVTIEHAVYGDLTGSLMLTNRQEVKKFLDQINASKSSLLMELTEGIHLHTIMAASEEILDKAVEALRTEGFILES